MVANKGFKEKEIMCNFVNTNIITYFIFELHIFTQGGLSKFFHP